MALVAVSRHQRHKNPHHHKSQADHQRGSAFVSGISRNAQELAQRDPELCNYESEHDDADAGANPGEEGAFVGEMVARLAGV